MKNLVIYDSLLPCIAGNDLVFKRLLRYVPYLIHTKFERELVEDLLRTLLQKHLHLEGIILDLEANLIPISEEGSVTVISPDTIDGLNMVEQLVREALAEVIVTRGEMELAAEAKIVSDCEDGIAEDDALYAAQATVVELDNRRPTCCCTGCPETDDIPEIDFDEDDLDEDNAFDTAKATVKQMGEPYGCGSGKYVCFDCSCWCAHREDPIPSLTESSIDDIPEIDVDGFPIEFPRTS